MWVLLIITIMAGGEQSSHFDSAIYAAQPACERAKAQAERRPATFGYCSFQANRKS
jgi:hypothetical protein